MSVAHWQGLCVLPGALGTLLPVSCACGHWPGQTGHRELAALLGAEVLELRVLAPVCTGSGRPSAGRSFRLCKFLLPPSPHVASRCVFPVSLFLFTRQDRYDCGPPTPFNSPAQEVPQQRTHGPSERVTPVLT